MTTTYRQSSQTVEFPTSRPEGSARVHIDLGKTVDEVPTWSIQTLNVGPLRSSSGYDRHLLQTVGSSYDWSDEIRFDKQTGRLVSFVLKTPEAGVVDAEIARSWLALPRPSGLPVLDDRENGFHIDPLELRYLAEDASALIAMDAKMPIADGSSLRLAIGNDVELLFHRDRYAGWILAKARGAPGHGAGRQARWLR